MNNSINDPWFVLIKYLGITVNHFEYYSFISQCDFAFKSLFIIKHLWMYEYIEKNDPNFEYSLKKAYKEKNYKLLWTSDGYIEHPNAEKEFMEYCKKNSFIYIIYCDGDTNETLKNTSDIISMKEFTVLKDIKDIYCQLRKIVQILYRKNPLSYDYNIKKHLWVTNKKSDILSIELSLNPDKNIYVLFPEYKEGKKKTIASTINDINEMYKNLNINEDHFILVVSTGLYDDIISHENLLVAKNYILFCDTTLYYNLSTDIEIKELSDCMHNWGEFTLIYQNKFPNIHRWDPIITHNFLFFNKYPAYVQIKAKNYMSFKQVI